MDPKRKKIYIVVIILCFGLSIGIIVWNNLGSSNVPTEDIINITPTTPTSDITSSSFTPGFSGPRVFPASNIFQTEVLESSAFKSLKPYQPVDITGKLGRPDPYRKY